MAPSKRTLPVPIGATLGSYRLNGVIGRGGVGTVYRATHVRLGRSAAIKILVPGQSADPEAVARMMREARIVNQIRHPSYVDVFDFIESDDPPCVALVMELLDGKGLDRFLAEGPVTLERAVDFTTQIAHALVVLHEAGVTHRDLKPSNVFVLADGRTLKLLDFGIAKLEHQLDDASLTATGVFLGTPRYMAPEQVTNDGVTAASDVYALGLMLHEMCTGRRLYEGTAIAIMHNKSLGIRPPLELGGAGSVEGLEALIEDCLAFAPGARPTATELEARLAGLDLSAPPTGTLDALPLVAHSTDVHALEAEAPPTVPIEIAAAVDTRIEAAPTEPRGRRWWLWGAISMAAAIAIVASQVSPRSSSEPEVSAATFHRAQAQPIVLPRTPTTTEALTAARRTEVRAAEAPEGPTSETSPGASASPEGLARGVQAAAANRVGTRPIAAKHTRTDAERTATTPDASAPDAGAKDAEVEAPAPPLTTVEIHTQDHEGRAAKTPIYLDGALAGISPIRTRVAEGRHVVEARPEGTRRARRSFVVEGGRSRAVRLVVCRPSDRATIAIASSPTDRPIEVDGRRVSRTPARVHVPACRKVVIAVDLGDGRVERAEVELEPGASVRRVFR